MNLSISIFSTFSENILKISTKYFRRKYLTQYFWWKICDNNFLEKIFDEKFQTKIFRQNISDENIWRKYFWRKYFDQIFQDKKIFDLRNGDDRSLYKGFVACCGLVVFSKRKGRERGSNSKNMCFEEFLTIFNSPSNYAYLKALLFLFILSNFE